MGRKTQYGQHERRLAAMVALAAAVALTGAVGLSGCAEQDDGVPLIQGALCSEMAPGTTTVGCLLQDPSAKRVKSVSRRKPHSSLHAQAMCEVPHLYDLGGGEFTVTDILVRTEPTDRWGEVAYYYAFLRLEHALLPGVPQQVVVRGVYDWAGVRLDVGERFLTWLRSPPEVRGPNERATSTNADDGNLDFIRLYTILRPSRTGSPHGAWSNWFDNLGYTHAEELAEMAKAFAQVAAGEPCTSKAGSPLLINLGPESEAAPLDPEPAELAVFYESCILGSGECFRCDDSGCERCDEDWENCAPVPKEEAMRQAPEPE